MKMKVNDIRQFFIDELKDETFTIDKTGQKTIELIGASFLADEPSIFGTPDQDYIDDEIGWYYSESTNINDIRESEPPKAWQYSANKHGEINSNYGLLIFSHKYFQQYELVLDELITNPYSRRAIMIYNRPSIWSEYNENGKNDFICTNAVTYYIRDNTLHAVVQMRSNDVVFGYKNDYAWQRHVLDRLVDDFNSCKEHALQITGGDITWQVQNLHVYERHFHLVK
jgi:thymidylate synthase|tara:strand:- start:1212 stop:1889 length:678 start_codon:yes stop_codon:yes gene_type:complete